MKKFTILILVVSMVLFMFSACSLKTEGETTTLLDKSSAEQLNYKKLYYDFFNNYKRAVNTFINVDFDKNNISDETLVMFAIEQLQSKSTEKLEQGTITQDEYDMEILQFFPSQIDDITNEFFGCKVKDYNTQSSQYNEESGAVVPLGWSFFNENKFILTDRQVQNDKSVKLKFDVYTFVQDGNSDAAKIDNNDFFNSTADYSEYYVGTVEFVCKESLKDDKISLQFIKGVWDIKNENKSN